MYAFRVLISEIVLFSVVTACFLPPAFAQTYAGEPSSRVTIDLGETPWKFTKTDPYSSNPSPKDSAYADGLWNEVAIPHCFNAEDTWLNCTRGMVSEDTVAFTVWYRKEFAIDAKYAGRRIELEFQGVNIGCAVYINGKFKKHIHTIAQPGDVTHVSGHLPFVIDITNDITCGAKNIIAVRVSNDLKRTDFFKNPGIGTHARWTMGLGGINRPVFLHITDNVHVPLNVYSNIRRWGTYVATTAATTASATVRIQTNVYNDNAQEKAVTVTTKIVDANKNVVWTGTSAAQSVGANSNHMYDQTATIANPRLWYPNNNVNGGPYLHKVYHIVQVNGQTVDVFTSPLGIRVITWDKDFAYINGHQHFFWGFGCRYEYPGFGIAVPEEQQWRDVKLAADCGGSLLRPGHVPTSSETVAACDAYGVCLFENSTDNEWAIKGETALTYKDEFHRDCIIRDRNHPSIAVWELNNGYPRNPEAPGSIRKQIDTTKAYDYLTPRAASVRDTTDYLPSSPGELIIGSLRVYRRKFLSHPAWAAESWCASTTRYSYDYEIEHADIFIQDVLKARNNGAGYAHWMLMETGGENFNHLLEDPAILNEQQKTLAASAMDQNRIPKLIYNVYKNALWIPYTTRPGVALQSHWNYPAGNRTVTAYSNCPSVELFVNGVSKGKMTPNATTTKCEWTNVAWQSGTLRAVGLNASGSPVCSDERKTAGPPSKIVLTPEPAIVRPDNGEKFMIRANGIDAAFILATIVDSAGNWCPLATDNITFNVTGQGTYVGSSNFIANLSKPLKYHAPGSFELAAEGGMIKIAVRATFTPGSFAVGATAPGLAAAQNVSVTTSGLTTVINQFAPPLVPSAFGARTRTFKIIGTAFAVPAEFSGKAVQIKVYNLSGKLLRDEVVKTKRFSFARSGITTQGMHIVRCREVQPAEGK